jgi:hypothetical protein
MDTLNALSAMGLTLPSPAYLLGSVLFGLIGFAAYRIGKQREASWTRWLGLALMLYPYAVSDTRLMYAVGAALCLALYWTKGF